MAQTNALPLNPVESNKNTDNDPHGANAARARIASLPNHYATAPMPSKSQLAKEAKPESPAALEQPLKSELPLSGEIPRISLKRKPQEEKPQTPKTNRSRSERRPIIPSRLKPILTAIATFVVLFSIFKSPIILSQLHYLTAKPKTAAPAAQTVAAVPPNPVISIPKINVNAPIVFAASNQEASIQKDLESGVVHYAGTAVPGEQGNSVLFGHSSNDWWEPGNYKFIFVLLDKLVPGDTFTVNYNSRQYLYKVSEVKVVEPTDLSVLNQTSDAEMTLITCTPPGTSWKRLIVVAKQQTPYTQKPATQTANSQNTNSIAGDSPGIFNQLGKMWDQFVGLFAGPAPSIPGGSGSSSSTTLPTAK